MSQPTIHFVYVAGESTGAPFCISHEVNSALSAKYPVKFYDWESDLKISPNPGDILLGHASRNPNTIFQRSYLNQLWSKVILLSPFAHKMPEYIAFLDPLIEKSFRYLAICGKYWSESLDQSLVSHWKPKIEQIDLAVRRDHYPFVKTTWNPVEKRKCLYIGTSGLNKGTDVLAKIIENTRHHLEWAWIGDGKSFSPHIKNLGKIELGNGNASELIKQYDFLVHTGRSDANPTTILEAASWGLLPICTKESGYIDEPWIINIPLDNLESSTKTILELNSASENYLNELQAKAKPRLERHFTWDRFNQQILDTISAPISTPVSISSHPDYEANVKILAALNRKRIRRDKLEHYSSFFKQKLDALKRRFLWH